MLSLTSSNSDLQNLAVGENVHVDVNLSGLAPGDQLVSLEAVVEYDSTLLDTATTTPGPVVPNPLSDPLDYSALSLPGLSDVAFLTFSRDSAFVISSNGSFFSMDLPVLATGSGALTITFADAQQVDPNDPSNLLSPSITIGSPLSFDAPSSVPEPSAFILWSVFGLIGAGWRCRRWMPA